MNKTSNGMRFNIRNKIFIGCACLFAVVLVTIVITMIELSSTQSTTNRVVSKDIPLIEHVSDINVRLHESIGSTYLSLLIDDKKVDEGIMFQWSEIDKDIKKMDLVLKESYGIDEVTENWSRAKILLEQYKNSQQKILSLSHDEPSRLKGIMLMRTELIPILEKIETVLGYSTKSGEENTGLSNIILHETRMDISDTLNGFGTLITIQWAMLIVAIIITILVTWLVSRALVNPIRSAIDFAKRLSSGERGIQSITAGNDETADLALALDTMQQSISKTENALKKSERNVQDLFADLEKRIRSYKNLIEKIAAGDLRERVVIEGEDDLSALGDHLNGMTSSLSDITSKIANCANQLTIGLSELENTAMSQASSATEQASSVSETTSVIEEIKATSSQTLEKAGALGDASEKTYEQGEKGRESITEAIDNMRMLQTKMKEIADTILSLSTKTQLIGEITDAVSGLAKQSKLLALNASIEAAKAGEAGKGFAVVAGEVKDLAEQSQQATNRVHKILQDIRDTTEKAVMVTEEGSKGVGASLQQVETTGGVIDSLAKIIQQSSMASKQIVAAVRQESAGIDQIVLSINEIDKVTKQFMDATEQTKQAAVSLAEVSNELRSSVSIYKIDNKDGN